MKFEAIHNALDCEQETVESGRFQWYTGPINLGPRRSFTYKRLRKGTGFLFAALEVLEKQAR